MLPYISFKASNTVNQNIRATSFTVKRTCDSFKQSLWHTRRKSHGAFKNNITCHLKNRYYHSYYTNKEDSSRTSALFLNALSGDISWAMRVSKCCCSFAMSATILPRLKVLRVRTPLKLSFNWLAPNYIAARHGAPNLFRVFLYFTLDRNWFLSVFWYVSNHFSSFYQ